MQHKIEQAGPLLAEDGTLRETGYAFRPVLDYDRKAVRHDATRIKEWDRYVIVDPDFEIDLSIADYSNIGVDSISFRDFSSSVFYAKNRIQLFEKGDKLLSPTSVIGDSKSKGRGYSIEFRNGGDQRHLVFSMKRFSGRNGISGDIVLHCPSCDHIVTAAPLAESEKLFCYKHRIQGMSASGTIQFGNREYKLTPGRSFGSFGWVRGVWSKSSEWIWGGAAGIEDGSVLSLNLGSGDGNPASTTENVIFCRGTAHKLSDAQWDIPLRSKSMPEGGDWHISSDDGRIDLVFTPHSRHENRLNLGFTRLEREQLFGTYTGNVMLDDGTDTPVSQLQGFVERVRNRW